MPEAIELLTELTPSTVLIEEEFIPYSVAMELGALIHTPATGRIDQRALDFASHKHLFADIRERATKAVQEFYELPPLYCDYVSLHSIGPGQASDFHPLHADMETLDGEPNHTPWRLAAALVYLNSQDYHYDGGTIRWPNLDPVLEVVPQAGMFVGFRGDRLHAHEVDPVTSGARKAIAMWFTVEPEREETGW